MRRLGLLAVPCVLAISGLALAQSPPPPPPPPPPATTATAPAAPAPTTAPPPAAPASTSASPFPAAGACEKDTDCKGDRICVQGQCVDPPQKTPPVTPTPTPTPAPAPAPAPEPPPAPAAETWTARGYTTARTTQPPPSAWDRVGLHGFEVQVRLGFMLPDGSSPVQAPHIYPDPLAVGDILAGKVSPYGLEPLGIVVTAGYRLTPWLSVGGFFTYASFDSLQGTDTGDYIDSTGGNTSQLERQMWTVGAYGRYYFTQFHRKLQPWIELGVGYSDDNANYVYSGPQALAGPEQEDVYLEERGVVFRATAGLDWRLAPVFSVGPWAAYERVVPITGCVEIDIPLDPTEGASQNPQQSVPNTCGGSTIQAHGYGVVSGGIALKLTVDPWPR